MFKEKTMYVTYSELRITRRELAKSWLSFAFACISGLFLVKYSLVLTAKLFTYDTVSDLQAFAVAVPVTVTGALALFTLIIWGDNLYNATFKK